MVNSAPQLVVTYKRRDEPQWLVDDLRTNLAWADDFVELQTDREAPRWPHEGDLLREQRRAIRARFPRGVWTLWVDPDERLEDRGARVVRRALERAERDEVFGFPLREMWTPTAWRCDGQWGNKLPRFRLFFLLPGGMGQEFVHKPIHCGVSPRGGRRRRTTLPVIMYHLKNIEPANRHARAEAYLAADPEFQHQRREGRDWTWLHDEAGLELREIEPARAFTPPYVAGSYLFTVPGKSPAESREDVAA